jgi:hypothetical protein
MPNGYHFEIPYDVRPMHVYIPGKTRFGKSTLMHWMALQDIANGNGVCVMDAKGDLVKGILDTIPEHRKDDVLFLDIETPVPLDFMGYQKEAEKESLVGELKYILMKKVEPSDAVQVNANITDILYTLLNFNENPAIKPEDKATFLDIYWFLEKEIRQKEIIAGLTDQNLVYRWRPENFPKPQERSRIATRMTPFVRSKGLTAIFGSPTPTFNVSDAMNQKKVLLVDLKGVSESQKAYGILLLAKIRQAAGRRADIPQKDRIPFYLYCDEFQKFQTSDFDEMLSMAGGYGLCLTLAHQFVDQLETQIRQSIFGNVSSFVCFRLGTASANALKGEIPKEYIEGTPTRPGIQNLARGEAIYRAADGTTALIHTPAPDFTPTGYAESIRKRTLENYAGQIPPKRDTDSSSPVNIHEEPKPIPHIAVPPPTKK